MHFDCQPENGVYIKLIFLNRYEDVLEEKVEKAREFTFTYPEDTYTYRISLLSAGFQELTFYDFSIKEIKSV